MMPDTREIKTTLALDGEKEFKAAMDEAYRGLKVLGSEMKLNTAIYGDNASSLEGLTKKGEILEKEIAKQKDIISTINKALDEAKSSYGENSKEAQQYQIKLNNATTTLTRMEGELKNNDAAIQNFGKETEVAEKKTRDWGDTLEKVGGVLGKTVTIAAKATATAVAAVGTAAGWAAKQVFDASVSAGKFADDLLTTSAQTGISTDSLQKWDYAARFIDTDVETMTGSMAKMIRQMATAQSGTGASAAAFKELGIGITDSNGKLRDSETVFFEAIDALGKISSETERDALSMQIFGKSAQDLNPLIKAGSDELNRLGQEAQNAGLVLDEQAVGALGNFDDTMQRIQAQTQGLSRSLAVEFLPVVSGVMTEVQTVLAGVGTALKDGFQPEDIQTIGSMISQKLIDGINTIAQYLPSVITTISGMLTQIVGVIVTILPTLLPPLMEGATQLLTGLLTALSTNIAPIAAAATTIVVQFITFLINNLPLLFTTASQLITSLADGITDALPKLIPAAIDGVMTFATAVINNLPDIIDAGLKVLVALVKGIIDAIPKLIDRIPEIIDAIVSTTMENLDLIIDAGIELTVAIAQGLINAIPKLVAKLPEIITSIVNGIGDGMGRILEIGGNIVSGIWEGIKNAGKWLYDKIAGWIDGVVGWIKGFLGIESPSTVMRDKIGLNMGKGVAEGIADSSKYVNAAMRDLVPDTGVMLDINRRFNNVSGSTLNPVSKRGMSTMSLSDGDISRLAVAIGKQYERIPPATIELNGRQFGKEVRSAMA
jgi:phage-related protein